MRHLLTLVALLGLFVACTETKVNTITGKVVGLEVGQRIVLTTASIISPNCVILDSTRVTKEGEFTLTSTLTDQSVFVFYLPNDAIVTTEYLNQKVNKRESYMLFMEGYSKMHIEGSTDDWLNLHVKGGLYDMPDMQKITKVEDEGTEMLKPGMKLWRQAQETKDPLLMEKAMQLLAKVSMKPINIMTDSLQALFISKHLDVAYSAELLRFNPSLNQNILECQKKFQALTPRVQQTLMGKILGLFIDASIATSIGGTAPDFELTSITGTPVKLTDFKGKYVIIDFWSSLCGYCRQSSPKLVEFYQKIQHNDSIVLVGIACREQDEDNWRKAVVDDHLDWIQLIDKNTKGYPSVMATYAIEAVPTCMLIDPKGKVLLRNLPLSIIPEAEALLGINKTETQNKNKKQS